MLEFIVFCGGAMVMALEMAGGRTLAPFVGTSAIVWASIIGVVLAFLALGAWAGGKFADRTLSMKGLSLILAGAGLGTMLTASFHAQAGMAATAMSHSLHLAAPIASAGIFAFPAFFFGAVSPYAIRLKLASISTAGATVGRLYALSTAGSILGTFLGGFILISWLSSTAILYGIALSALALSAFAFFPGRMARGASALAAALLFLVFSWDSADSSLIESPYNVIRIAEGFDRRDGAAVRLMMTSPRYGQSGMFLDDPERLYFDYTKFYALGPAMRPDARKILMLGGGGYSVPKWLLAGRSALADPDGMELTVVEIDPVMTETARRLFALKDDPRMRIEHEDARTFLNRNGERHDLVFVDLFNSHYAVPFHAGTREAMERLSEAVADDGIVIMNVIGAIEGDRGRLFRSIWPSLKGSFPHARIYLVQEPDHPEKPQNVIVAASRSPLPEIGELKGGIEPSAADMARMDGNIYAKEIPMDVGVLTDDFAPVDRYFMKLAD